MRDLLANIRYALRQFRMAPIFTAAAILTLALGIGGTTAIFTLIHAVMLRSLPVSDPSRLYRVGEGDDCCVEGGPQDKWGMFPYSLFLRLKAQAPEFEELAAFQAGSWRATARREGVESAARPLRSEYVTGNYFSTLGVGAFAGRVLTPNDDTPSSPPVAVLSHRAWQTTYGGDTSVLGSTFAVQGHPFTIIGIAPPGFFGETLGGDPPDIWIPLQQEAIIDGETALLHQGDDMALNQAETRELGVEVAHDPIRHADVFAQDPFERGIHCAALHHLHGRNLQSFLEHLAGIRRAHAAADVRRMRHGPREGDQTAIEVDRLRHRDVGQMPGAEPAIVGDEDVALMQVLWRPLLEKRANGPRRRPDEGRDAVRRLGDRASLRVGDDAGKIVGLANDRRERRPHQRGCGFIDDRDEPPPQQFQRYSVEHGSSGARSVRQRPDHARSPRWRKPAEACEAAACAQ